MAVGLAFPAAADAAAGDLDPGFSGDGLQTTQFGGAEPVNAGAAAMVLQLDGKIVAAGRAGNSIALARYNPNGSLDKSFSGDGVQTTDFGHVAYAADVALQRDGKIVIAGRTTRGRGDFALARYNPTGSLDPSFSGNGKLRTDFHGLYSHSGDGASDVTIQPNGKIVAVGWRGDSFAAARYNPNGSLDPSFSGDGMRTIAGHCRPIGMAIQADGRIVTAGEGAWKLNPNTGGTFCLARLNRSGSLDKGFSGDGLARANFGEYNDAATAVAIQPDGRIIAVGRGGATAMDFALARFNPGGSLDKSFSRDGTKTTDFGGYDGAVGVAIQGNGEIVAAGYALDASDFALARFNPGGSLDKSFSGDGMQTTDLGEQDGASDVAIQPNGKIVAVGGSGGGATTGTFALVRYLGR